MVPAYNEERRLAPTVRDYLAYFRARGSRIELIVVDDGSTDGTAALVAELADGCPEVRLLRLAQNQGKGYAVRSGVVNARGRLVLFADADGSTPIAEIERLERAIAGGADVAIGSRAMPAADVEVRARLHRRIIGRIFHGLVWLAGVRGIRDTQCGFKLFRGPVAHALFSRMRISGFSFDVELLLMARICGFRVTEVPVNWVHRPGSRINLLTDSARMAADLLRIRVRRLTGEYRLPHVAPLSAGEATVRPAP